MLLSFCSLIYQIIIHLRFLYHTYFFFFLELKLRKDVEELKKKLYRMQEELKDQINGMERNLKMKY